MGELPLPPNQTLAASTLGMGESHKRAAEVAKVTPQTISEWKQRPEFLAAINKSKSTMLKESQDRFRAQVSTAIEVVSKTMTESDNERLRLDAAKYVLDTIRISPSKDMGLWNIGPTTGEGIVEEELNRIDPLRSILNDDSNL